MGILYLVPSSSAQGGSAFGGSLVGYKNSPGTLIATHYLYILISKGFKRHYIGISSEISRRLVQHNQGKVVSTKAYRPWAVAGKIVFPNKTEARKEEIRLKKNY